MRKMSGVSPWNTPLRTWDFGADKFLVATWEFSSQLSVNLWVLSVPHQVNTR